MFNFLSKQNQEAIKEVARWVVFFVISWVISETLKQINLIPENYVIRAFVFTYSVPVRTLLTLGLTMAGRYADKYVYIENKMNTGTVGGAQTKGLLPF